MSWLYAVNRRRRHLPSAGGALLHGLLRKVSIGAATDGAADALVALLVARVAHRVGVVPARADTGARSARAAVGTQPTVLPAEGTQQQHVSVSGR